MAEVKTINGAWRQYNLGVAGVVIAAFAAITWWMVTFDRSNVSKHLDELTREVKITNQTLTKVITQQDKMRMLLCLPYNERMELLKKEMAQQKLLEGPGP
jgi:hypothetical protein